MKLTNAGSRRGERGVVNAGSRRGERGVVSGTRSKRNSRRMSFGGFLGKQATTSTRLAIVSFLFRIGHSIVQG